MKSTLTKQPQLLSKTIAYEIPWEDEVKLVRRINRYCHNRWNWTHRLKYFESELQETYWRDFSVNDLFQACFDVATDMFCPVYPNIETIGSHDPATIGFDSYWKK